MKEKISPILEGHPATVVGDTLPEINAAPVPVSVSAIAYGFKVAATDPKAVATVREPSGQSQRSNSGNYECGAHLKR
jgi:hypothetical protein